MTGLRPIEGRVPPHDLDAEGAVLAAVLLDSTALERVREILKPEHFYSDANATIFEAAKSLASVGTPIDIVTVSHWLRDRERLGGIGGPNYLAQIADATPAVAHVAEHARLVVNTWRVRVAIAEGNLTAAEGYGIGADVEPWLAARRLRLSEALAPIESSAEPPPPRRTLAERSRELAAMDPPVRLALGIPTLDRLTRGGVPVGSRVVLVGPPGASKTALAVQWAHDWARGGARVAMLCADQLPDMTLVRVGEREGLARDDLEGIGGREPRCVAWRELAYRLDDLGNLLLLDGSEETLEAAAKALAALPGDGPRALLLDSLQTVLCAAAMAPGLSRRQQIDAALGVVKAIAASGVLVVVISEMARGGYASPDAASRTSGLASGKESGAIEYGAELHLALRSVRDEPDLVDVEVAKNRLGPREDFRLRIDFHRAQLTEVAAPSAEDANETAKAATRSALMRDAEALRVVAAAHPGGLDTRGLRAAVKAAGHAWGVQRIDAAHSVLESGHAGVRLVDRGPHKQARSWRLEPIGEVSNG